MTRVIGTGLTVASAVVAAAPMTARQNARLKDLIPSSLVIGVAINQRQSDGVDAPAVDIIWDRQRQAKARIPRGRGRAEARTVGDDLSVAKRRIRTC